MNRWTSGYALVWWGIVVVAVVSLTATPARAGQLGALVSPGPLSQAHAKLEGIRNCTSCHEAGRRVTVGRCLTCHQPIAQRIARKTGVHRNAGADCVACHVEHAGRTADLRRVDVKTFNHATETGFALDGLHKAVAGKCVSCHKGRSFLEARPACSSCHTDPHSGALGSTCTTCHSTSTPFKNAGTTFDHSRARFALTGAHQQVACAQCHKAGGTFRGVAFDSCASCHTSPHRADIGANCASCHTTTTSWNTRTVAHARTRFPLVGAHATLTCEKCHTSGDMAKAIPFAQCSSCHANVHGDSITGDCATCHTETAFHVAGPTGAAATFDHATTTGFALDGRHATLSCRQCHVNVSAETVPLSRKNVDFGGASRECVSCHMDKHNGENGLRCQACHQTTTFDVSTFRHPRRPEFFGGEHGRVACVRCHVPEGQLRPTRVGGAIVLSAQTTSTGALAPAQPTASSPSMACRTCHSDPHLGQLGSTCETCHEVSGVGFAPTAFSHTRTTFPLTGRHAEIECVSCHAAETAQFPAGTGTAKRFAPMTSSCQTCHKDPHLGQMTETCDTCHTTTSFSVPTYTHPGLNDVFSGFHGRLACVSCHTQETGTFPAGQGTAVRYRIERACVACHRGF